MQCGPIRHHIDRGEVGARRVEIHEIEFTTEETGADGASIQAIYTELASNAERNELIVADILAAAVEGRASLVLTNRLEHLDVLAADVAARCDIRVISLHGRLTAARRRELRVELTALDESGTPFVLVAIDKIAGEGLDLPTLNTLFLTVPVSFKGRVIQQIGRVTRNNGGGDVTAIVHDYRDGAVPRLAAMHARRRRVMAKEGFVTS